MAAASLEQLIEAFPDYAQDIRLNVSSLLRMTELSPVQLWGTFLACASACNSEKLLQVIKQEAQSRLSAEQIRAALGAAALMAMNNVYYRFQHLCSNPKYGEIPARLRMNFLRSHGVDSVDFELWCLAVSAINACGMCIESHERVLREKGLSEEAIAAAVRVAAVVHAAAVVVASSAL